MVLTADANVKPYQDAMKPFNVDTLKSKNPVEQFTDWYDAAKNFASDMFDPDTMTLATATKTGVPSCRMVLLKGYDNKGFKFYGSYTSRKSVELMENPQASLQFYWEPFKRSVRIEGTVEKLTDAENDEYFKSRSKSAQVSALVSQQSKIIDSRKLLDEEFKRLEIEYADKDVTRPAEWGGFRVKPVVIEFWQGQTNRLHDRLQFRKAKPDEQINEKLAHRFEDGWVMERLSP